MQSNIGATHTQLEGEGPSGRRGPPPPTRMRCPAVLETAEAGTPPSPIMGNGLHAATHEV